jgi:hypothetical protein
MLIEECPHCETHHVQTEPRFREEFILSKADTSWIIVRCQNPKCHRLILLITDPNNVIERNYPVSSFELNQNITIDHEIRDDFKEAGLCLSAGCYKASMVMSRRVLQRCLKEQGCTQRKLVDAINFALEQGILRRPFHSIATEIREYGNLGAHPDDDQLANVDASKAKQVLDFARLLIHDFYEVPQAAENLRQAREGNSQSE